MGRTKTPEQGPELYSDINEVPLGAGEKVEEINIEVSPDGGYNGNHFFIPNGRNFIPLGFDRTNGREFWFSKGFVNATALQEYLDKKRPVRKIHKHKI